MSYEFLGALSNSILELWDRILINPFLDDASASLVPVFVVVVVLLLLLLLLLYAFQLFVIVVTKLVKQVMCKSFASHIQVICKTLLFRCKSFASHLQVMCKSYASYLQVMSLAVFISCSINFTSTL